MKITFCSDVHGKFEELNKLLDKTKDHPFVQLGDLGIGFKNNPKSFPNNFHFIRGNHSNPAECKTYPNYLGDFGYNEKLNLFFVGGAWSIDWEMRKEGVSWWPDEELSMKQCNDALEFYEKIKPKYMISHDAPNKVKEEILSKMVLGGYKAEPTRTGQLLTAMFDIHQPKIWCFAHYHVYFRKIINGTEFICMPELGTINLNL